MRKIVFSLALMAALISAPGGFASGLVPNQSPFGTQPVISYPLIDIGFTFDDPIGIVENAVATVYSGEQTVATGALSASNYYGHTATQGMAVVTFEEPLVLPKGGKYRIVVPEDVIFKANYRHITNDELTAEFEVPADLGPARPTIDEGKVLVSTNRIGFFFGFETAPVEGCRITLYREGIPVREYPCAVSWDWNLGYAGVEFGEYVNFEAGVRYTLTLPEGSVSTLHRPDITNKEASVSFIGGYTEPVKTVHYVWCSLFDHHLNGVIGEVKFYYDQPVALSVNPRVQLCIVGEDTVVKEVVPVLAEEDGQYVMTVDFGQTPLEDGKGYTIVIPEGTLVTENGDILVNSRNVMDLDSTNGIAATEAGDAKVTMGDGVISIKNIPGESVIALYSLGGELLHEAASAGGSVAIPAPGPGIYLLTINGKACKIAVK